MKRYFLIIFFILVFSLIPRPGLVLTVSPPILEIELEAGQRIRAVIKVFNETEQNLYLKSSIETFEALGEEGQLKFSGETKKDFLEWFEISAPTLVLKPGEIGLIPFTITVPPAATPGGYYAAILWEQSPVKIESGLGISGKIGTLILLKIKGEVTEAGQLLEFKAIASKKFNLPLNFLIRFQNLGNIHLRPQGKIIIRNFLGATSKILEVNPTQKAVLSQSIRRFEVVWGQKNFGKFFDDLKQEFNYLLPGKYSAELEITSGTEEKQNFKAYQSFWLIPYRLISSFLILMAILGILMKIKFLINKKDGEKK